MKDSLDNNWVTIPLKAVSSRAFIEYQCGSDTGMTLNRLAEVCGCFSHKQESFGCHHPETTEDCLAGTCPLAYINFPENASEEECDRYAEGYGDEVRMCLAEVDDEEKGKNFGESGVVRAYYLRELLRADEFVNAALYGPVKACTDTDHSSLSVCP